MDISRIRSVIRESGTLRTDRPAFCDGNDPTETALMIRALRSLFEREWQGMNRAAAPVAADRKPSGPVNVPDAALRSAPARNLPAPTHRP